MVAMDAAWPLVDPTDPTVGLDNDRVFRKFLACLLLPDEKSNNPLAVRAGVVPHSWDADGCTSLRVTTSATSSAVDVLAGPVICERAGQGPYPGWTESTKTVPLPQTDAANDRYDTLYALVNDQASIGTDSGSGGVLAYVEGTAQTNPPVPADADLPEGAQRLADVRRVVGVATPRAQDITDRRKGTCVTGGVRRFLPGDSVTDAGRVDAELRQRPASGALPAMVDWWDAKQGLWRGTQGFSLSGMFPGSPDQYQKVSGTVHGGNNVLITVTVPDPGYPYRVTASGTFQLLTLVGNSSINYYASVNYGQFAGSFSHVGSTGLCPLLPVGSTIYTGSATIRLIIDVLGSDNSATWQADARNPLAVRVEPA